MSSRIRLENMILDIKDKKRVRNRGPNSFRLSPGAPHRLAKMRSEHYGTHHIGGLKKSLSPATFEAYPKNPQSLSLSLSSVDSSSSSALLKQQQQRGRGDSSFHIGHPKLDRLNSLCICDPYPSVYDTAEHVCELVGGDCVVVVGVEDPEGMVEVLLDGGGVSRNGGVEHRELVEAELMKSSSSASALSIMRAMVMRSRA
jgi:hypothetical protein